MPLSPEIANALRMLAGAGVGAGVGYYVAPQVGGYEDIESSRRFSAGLNSSLGALVGAGASAHGGYIAALKRLAANPKIIADNKASIIGGLGLDMLPVAQSTLRRSQQASQAQAESAKVTSIPYNLSRALATPTARGVGVGVGVAGLGALTSGLLRRRSDREMRDDKSRAAMMGSDFLKYLIPAAVAGGVLGSLRQSNATPAQ